MFDKSKEKKEMSQKEAFAMLREWGDDLEVRLLDDDFHEVQKELWMAVKKERLVYDKETETFTYALKKPIIDKSTGQSVISIIKIHESDMNDKRAMKKEKEDIDANANMFKAYCKTSEMEEIEHGFMTRIKDRDQLIISAVILGFFVQAVPGNQSVG